MAVNLIHNKWRITRRIGGGSFGEIYMGVGPNNEKVNEYFTFDEYFRAGLNVYSFNMLIRLRLSLKKKALDVRSFVMSIKYTGSWSTAMDFVR